MLTYSRETNKAGLDFAKSALIKPGNFYDYDNGDSPDLPNFGSLGSVNLKSLPNSSMKHNPFDPDIANWKSARVEKPRNSDLGNSLFFAKNSLRERDKNFKNSDILKFQKSLLNESKKSRTSRGQAQKIHPMHRMSKRIVESSKKSQSKRNKRKRYIHIKSAKKNKSSKSGHFYKRGVNYIAGGYPEHPTSTMEKSCGAIPRSSRRLSEFMKEYRSQSHCGFNDFFQNLRDRKKKEKSTKIRCSLDDRNPTFSSNNYDLSIKKPSEENEILKKNQKSKKKKKARKQKVFKHEQSIQNSDSRSITNLSLASIKIDFLKGKIGIGVQRTDPSRKSFLKKSNRICLKTSYPKKDSFLSQKSKSFLSRSTTSKRVARGQPKHGFGGLLEVKGDLQRAIGTIDENIKDFLGKLDSDF